MSVCLKKEILMAFADRELPPGETELAERHFANCATCKRKLESVRATTLKVNSLLSLLAPEETADAVVIARIPHVETNVRMRWAAVASVGMLAVALILFVILRRQHSAPALNIAKSAVVAPVLPVEKNDVLVAAVAKPAHVATPKPPVKLRQFQALDDGEPIETGMIYRVSLPAPASSEASAQQSTRRIPAEVIVDEFGKVRAIRFLQ
jgi:anti-sigma factor RsiW